MSHSYTIQTLAELSFQDKFEIIGNKEFLISGVSDLASANESEIAFFANERYLSQAKKSKAGAIIITEESYKKHFSNEEKGGLYLIHENPTAAFQAILTLFQGSKKPLHTGFQGIHPTAVIHPTASIGDNVSIGPYVVIDELAEVGSESTILPHAYISRLSKIGKNCLIHAHTVIREGCIIGDRVIIQPGAVIGSCGFGYVTSNRGEHSKLEHWGSVVLENDVEIGANSTLDRGRFHETRIGTGTKIDNLVQIGHNVKIGSNSLLIAQVGVAGSATIGNYVVLAGKAGVNGHITICDKVIIAACSGVTKSVTKPGTYAGMPLLPVSQHNRNIAYIRKIEEILDRLSLLEKR